MAKDRLDDIANTLDDIAITLDEIQEQNLVVNVERLDRLRQAIEKATDAIDRLENSRAAPN